MNSSLNELGMKFEPMEEMKNRKMLFFI